MTDSGKNEHNSRKMRQSGDADFDFLAESFDTIWRKTWDATAGERLDADVGDIEHADIRPHLEQLHRLWNVSRDPSDQAGEPSLEKETWFRLLSEMNRCWDIRSSLEQLSLSSDQKNDIEQHYPAILERYLGLSPSPVNDLEKLQSLRTECSEEIEALHEAWNIDSISPVRAGDRPEAGKRTLKERLKGLVKRLVRVHTDPLFQRQRDFNAQMVGLTETMVNAISSYQHRSTRMTMELVNRQYRFNVLLVQFMNSFLQDIIFSRQQNYNAELVQVVQKILQRFPELMLERSEILYSQLMAEFEQLKKEIDDRLDEGSGKSRKANHGD